MRHEQYRGSSVEWGSTANSLKGVRQKVATKQRPYRCGERGEERHKMPDVVWSCEMKANSSNDDWKWQKRCVSYPNYDNYKWKSGQSWKQKWISDTSREWDRISQGFREHIAVDGSLKGVS